VHEGQGEDSRGEAGPGPDGQDFVESVHHMPVRRSIRDCISLIRENALARQRPRGIPVKGAEPLGGCRRRQ
jgi:hypothetical protein